MATLLADLRAKLNGELGVLSDSESTPWSVAVRNAAIRDGYAALWREGVWKPVRVDVATSDNGRVYPVSGLIRRVFRVELLEADGTFIQKMRAVLEPDGSETATTSYELIVPPQTSGYILRCYGYTAYRSALPEADPDRFVVSVAMANKTYTLANTTQVDGVARPVVAKVTKVDTNDTVGTLTIAGTTSEMFGLADSEALTLNNGDTASGTTTTTKSFYTASSIVGTGWTTSGGADTITVGTGDPVDDLPDEHNRVPLLKAKAILLRAALATFARYGERQALPPEMNLTVDQLLGLVAAAEREFEVECRSLAGLRLRGGGTMAVP